MTIVDTAGSPLNRFIAPFIDQPVWGTRQGHGSFLDLNFGTPELIVRERQSKKAGKQRDAFVQGQWHVWIYCCHWHVSVDGDQIAWSEDERQTIARATGMLDGQKLTAIEVDPSAGTSRFVFDLGGLLETRPYGDDPTEEQWYIFGRDEIFAYRADGCWSRQPPDTPREAERWQPWE